jgi:hypothetical protein
MIAASVTFWVRWFPVLRVAVAADWDTLWVLFLWALTRAMSTPKPQAARRLLAVHPDVARTLTIVALCKPVLESIPFDLYNYITECCQFENVWSSLIPCYRNWEDGEGGVWDFSFWSGTFSSRLFYADGVVAYLLEGHSDVLCRNIARQMPGNGFDKVSRIFVKCKEVEIFLR